jgi:nicotinate-nucleotide pyrophosphorylase (carboxylating)
VSPAPDPLGTNPGIVLDPEYVRDSVARFLAEDVRGGDVTTRLVVPAAAHATGRIVARQDCVLAGLDVAREVFRQLDSTVTFEARAADGDGVACGACVAVLRGPAAPILTGERTALNLLQRLSGVATVTRRYVDAVAGTGATVSDTRKTTPGLRLFEKYAVRAGGGRNHRIGLFDAALIKDNHLVAAGGVGPALDAALATGAAGVPVQLEVDSLEQLACALRRGVRAVLLDNMSPHVIAEAVRLVRQAPGGAACWVEASGGITLANIRAYADAGVDTVSVGALTHSAPSVDLALDFEPVPRQD